MQEWDFIDLPPVPSKYTHYLSQEYNPLKPHDYYKVKRLVKEFKRSLSKTHHTPPTGVVEAVSSKARVLLEENADQMQTRRAGGVVIKEEMESVGDSRVLLFYRIENSKMEEWEIKAQILKLVEPFGKILEIMLDRVPDWIGLSPEDNLRIYVKFKDLNSCAKAYSSLLGSKFNHEPFVLEYFDEASFDDRDLY